MYRTNRSYVINVIGLWEFLEYIYDFLSMWLMVIGRNHKEIESNIQIHGTSLEQVSEFKSLGCTLSEDGKCTKELRIRLSMAHSALNRLGTVWKSSGFPFPVKLRLLRAIVCSVRLYGCESWTFTEEVNEKHQAFKYKCYRRLLNQAPLKGGLPFDWPWLNVIYRR